MKKTLAMKKADSTMESADDDDHGRYCWKQNPPVDEQIKFLLMTR
jgi:hypothetical protein